MAAADHVTVQIQVTLADARVMRQGLLALEAQALADKSFGDATKDPKIRQLRALLAHFSRMLDHYNQRVS